MAVTSEVNGTQQTENPDAPAKGMRQRITRYFRNVANRLPFGASRSAKAAMIDSRDYGAIILSAREWEDFCNTLDNPPKPSAYVVEAYERYKKKYE